MTRKPWVLALLVVTGCGAQASPATQAPAASTVEVERGDLSATVALNGTLTYRARSDGSPYALTNYARGIYTKLPREGDKVRCGDVLYRVDGEPVRLRCGAVPPYRALRRGDAVFLPRAGWISKVTGELGGPARPGEPVAQATSATLEVQVDLEASQQGEVSVGDRARITLPGNRSVTGKVQRLGTVAQTPEQDGAVGSATIPAAIALDDPAQARGLDHAPVRVEVTTKGVENALSVPVTALVGKAGGGFAVEVVRDGERRELVAVQLGLFDTGNGRVEVTGALDAGARVVVPSS
ncbi:HlyD family efflux transporter periplasmic adaptor subunit [Solirubrobacter taibaiensis]|nr:HlyD family efflux transporter periplasmic adaptor subunit [Solirubrobacter taibaiensis]